MRLLLIRHGESEHSVQRLIAGANGCPGLTALGRAQAENLRDRLGAEPDRIDALVSSTVLRARETAEILAPALNPPVTVGLDCDLCEMHVGEGDGLSSAEFTARYGSFNPQTEPDRELSPGGDSWNTFTSRVHRTLATLAERHRGVTVAAVTHAGFIVQTFLELFAVERPGTGGRIDPDFSSITEWEHDESGDFWRLVRFNDTAHLPPA